LLGKRAGKATGKHEKKKNRGERKAKMKQTKKTDPSTEDLVDGGGFLERALRLHHGPHLLHVEHERVQRLLDVRLLRIGRKKPRYFPPNVKIPHVVRYYFLI
jgi:hypothetical protein